MKTAHSKRKSDVALSRPRRAWVTIIASAIAAFATSLCCANDADTAVTARTAPLLHAALTFESNVGQLADTVVARISGPAGGIDLTSNASAVFNTSGARTQFLPHAQPQQRAAALGGGPGPNPAAIRLVSANVAPAVELEELARTRSNYLVGNNPALWRTNIAHYRRLRYHDVYPGVDQVYYGKDGHLEFDFILKPGADPRQIRVTVDGDGHPASDGDGGLIIATGSGSIVLHRPLAYQDDRSDHAAVTAIYRVQDDHSITIDVGAYDTGKSLTIDPVLDYSTLLGGLVASGIAVDPSGAVYVTGENAKSGGGIPNPLVPPDGIQTPFVPGDGDVLVWKISPDGQEVEYATLIGSGAEDVGKGIAVDTNGEVVVGLVTQGKDFPVVNPLRNDVLDQSAIGAPIYNVIARLAADGASLRYSYYHSLRSDAGLAWSRQDPAIAIDSAGRTIVGAVGSVAAAVTPAAPSGEAAYRCDRVVLTRISADGMHEEGSLCTRGQNVNAVATDPRGRVHMTGTLASAFFGSGSLSTVVANATPFDSGAWISKIDFDASSVIYDITLAGGKPDRDEGSNIAADADGNTYVVGRTTSPLFPLVNARESGLTTRRLPTDLLNRSATFVMKIDSAGSQFDYCVFLNLDGRPDKPPHASGLVVDTEGHAFVAGDSSPGEFSGLPVASNVAYQRAFLAKLDTEGASVLYVSRLGGRYESFNVRLAQGNAHQFYLSGVSTSPDFPLQDPLFGWTGGVFADASLNVGQSSLSLFLAKFTEDVPSDVVSIASAAEPADFRTPVWLTATVPAASGNLTWYVDGRKAAVHPLTAGRRDILFSPGILPAGRHLVRAEYVPADRAVLPKTAEYTQTVLAPADCP